MYTPNFFKRSECFQLGEADRHSLDFTFNRLRVRLFKTGSIDVVKDCQSFFAIDLPSCVLKSRQLSRTLLPGLCYRRYAWKRPRW